MDPVIVHIGPFAVRWYGVMLAMTIAVSMVVAYRLGPRFGITTEILDRTAVNVAVTALAGARLGYVVSHPAEFHRLLDVFRIDLGGLGSHGAIAAGFLYVLWASRRYRISIWNFGDVFGWAIPIGHVFVRIGNFVNGELYGDPTTLPWGVRFRTSPDLPRHPLQIYEMVVAVLILLSARKLVTTRRFEGQIFWTIMVLTSAGRLFVDALRSEAHTIGPLALGQYLALLLLLWGVYALRAGNRRASDTEASAPSA